MAIPRVVASRLVRRGSSTVAVFAVLALSSACSSTLGESTATTASAQQLVATRDDGALTFEEWNADVEHRQAIGTGFYAAQQMMGIMCEEIAGSISQANAREVILSVAAKTGDIREEQAEGLLWFAGNHACYEAWHDLPEFD